MWIFEQRSGRLYHEADPETIYVGYAGRSEGKNNPEMQDIPNVGPLPCGFYEIGPPNDTPDHGPYVLRLTPAPENEMFGRHSFLIHGDSRHQPGTASEGCMIFSKPARMAVWLSGDVQLKVIATGA